MMLPKKIAILTLSVGAGHVRAAEEIQRALADREDHTEARLLDAVELGSAWFRRLYVDFYCVATDESRSQLIGWGVSPNRVLVCGIPIDPAFALAYDKPGLMKSMGLD